MIDRLACGSILHQLPNVVSQLLDSHPTLPEAKFGPLQAGILLDRGTVVFDSLVHYFASYIADTELLQYLHLTSELTVQILLAQCRTVLTPLMTSLDN